jgi:hypothetical protein
MLKNRKGTGITVDLSASILGVKRSFTEVRIEADRGRRRIQEAARLAMPAARELRVLLIA